MEIYILPYLKERVNAIFGKMRKLKFLGKTFLGIN